MTKPKSKKWTEVTGQGLPLDPEASFELSLGSGSASSLQQPEVMTAVDMGGGLFVPISSKMPKGAEDALARQLCFPPKGTDSCLNTPLPVNLSSIVSEGFAKWAIEVAHSLLLPAGSRSYSYAPDSSMYTSSPVQAYVFPGMSLPAISGPVSAFSGSPSAIASSAYAPPLEKVSVPFGCSDLDSKGFSPALDLSEVGSNSFNASAFRAVALGERLSFSLSVMSTPIYSFESKSVPRYHRRLKVGKGAQMDASLFDEVVTALNAPTTPSLGASS
jgi:hypothetical protein